MKRQMTPEEIEAQRIRTAEMIAKRQAEIADNIVWWRKQEKIRVDGFDIEPSDPMFKRMSERYIECKLEELL